jgi:hypothetical protein
MSIKILSTKRAHEWADYLARLPHKTQDICASPFYYQIYEDCGYGIAEGFIHEEDDRFVLYPYLRNSINVSEANFLKRFSETFTDYCVNNNIIAEFTRFNPIIANHRWLSYVEVSKAKEVVNIDLSPPEETIWTQSYEREVRRIIRKAEDMGYRHRTILLNEATNKDVEDFRFIYYSTLDRNKADQFYYFNDSFFLNLRKKISRNTLLSIIYTENQPIGASINPFLGMNGYGLFAGSLGQYKKVSPFTFMIHKVVLRFKELGIQNFLLGGGIRLGDNIFKYKKSFSLKGVMDFFIGTKVHNRDVYDSLCRAWMERYPEKAAQYGHYFLKYRY